VLGWVDLPINFHSLAISDNAVGEKIHSAWHKPDEILRKYNVQTSATRSLLASKIV
jgi:hypothetical protein